MNRTAKRRFVISTVALSSLLLNAGQVVVAAEPNMAPLKQLPVLEIAQSTKLDPKQTYGTIVVMASDIVIDGQGARLVGNTSRIPQDFTETSIPGEHRHKDSGSMGWPLSDSKLSSPPLRKAFKQGNRNRGSGCGNEYGRYENRPIGACVGLATDVANQHH